MSWQTVPVWARLERADCLQRRLETHRRSVAAQTTFLCRAHVAAAAADGGELAPERVRYMWEQLRRSSDACMRCLGELVEVVGVTVHVENLE